MKIIKWNDPKFDIVVENLKRTTRGDEILYRRVSFKEVIYQ